MADNVAEMTEAMPVVPAVEAFLSYLSLHDRTQLDIMLHRSGRHPDNLNWSADPKFVKKARVYGRATSGDDSELYKKTLQEQRNVEKRQARRSVMNAKANSACSRRRCGSDARPWAAFPSRSPRMACGR
jgi:hypothetical protein